MCIAYVCDLLSESLPKFGKLRTGFIAVNNSQFCVLLFYLKKKISFLLVLELESIIYCGIIYCDHYLLPSIFSPI